MYYYLFCCSDGQNNISADRLRSPEIWCYIIMHCSSKSISVPSARLQIVKWKIMPLINCSLLSTLYRLRRLLYGSFSAWEFFRKSDCRYFEQHSFFNSKYCWSCITPQERMTEEINMHTSSLKSFYRRNVPKGPILLVSNPFAPMQIQAAWCVLQHGEEEQQ